MSRKVSRSLIGLCAGVVLLLIGGCPYTFTVLYPTAMQTTSQDFQLDNGKIVIRVTFSKPVDMSSLIAGTNVILVTETDPNANITITAGTTAADILITTVDDASDLLNFDPDGFFTLRLLGSGANPIKSSTGEVLDGDGDGTAGGNYETTFVLIG